jgi:hypothetical protein
MAKTMEHGSEKQTAKQYAEMAKVYKALIE